MNTHPRSTRFIAPLLCGLATLLLALPARANIALQDGSATYTHQTSTAISKSFTVTTGASVLVVTLADESVQAGYPASLTWSGQTVTRAITATANMSTYRNVAIYYLYNPTPGTGTITGTAVSGVGNVWLAAYTLSGTLTSSAPMTGSASNTAASSLTFNVAGVAIGSWAAVDGAYANNTSSPVFTITGTGGTATTSTDLADAGTPVTMGYIANLSAGTDTFTYGLTSGGVASQKTEFAAAIFAPVSFTVPVAITTQPLPSIVYTNVTVTFTAAATGAPAPVYYWQKNAVNLTDGGNISGSTNATLTVSGVSASDVASYTVVVSNAVNAVTSSVATLSVVAPVEPYEQAVANLNPVAFYQFNDTNDTASGLGEAFDNAGGFNGLYGTKVQNGSNHIAGPTSSSGFPGFNSTNLAASFATAAGNNVTVPPWNFSGNSLTFTAWINPGGTENVAAGLVFCRGATVVSGFNYFGSVTNGVIPLSYTWDNDPGTYLWSSGLVPPPGQWSFVALAVTPASATIYMMNANGLTASTHVYPHDVQSFNTNTLIGEDNFDGGNGARSFLGTIDDVAVFNTALSGDQVAGLFYAATAVTNYTPVIGVPPVSQSVYAGQTVQFYVGADGSDPLTYQWAAAPTSSGGPYVNLVDGVNGVSGSQTATLTIANVSAGSAMDYVVTVANNALGSPVVSAPATLTVNADLGPAILNITMSAQEAAGDDWNIFTAAPADAWNDGVGGLPASVSAVEYPGSTYEILPGARMRSPANTTYAVFPGDKLLLDGAGFANNPGPGTNQGELRFKEPVLSDGSYGTVTFPLLVFNGGQLDIGNDGVVPLYGVINVLSNGLIYSDSTDDRGYVIHAQLTGTNSFLYYGDGLAYPETYSNIVNVGVSTNSVNTGGYTNNLDIAGANNTFTGPWFVEDGMLLGSVNNTLGTNNITVLSNGVFQTLYDMNSPNANLVMQGKMFLTQNDTFSTVIVGSSALTPGTYTAAQLCSNYPAYFPSNWIPHFGAAMQTNATGSLTVLLSPGASIIQNPQPVAVTWYPEEQIQFSALGGGNPPLYFQWQLNGANLTNGATIVGAQTETLSLPNGPSTEAGSYTIVVSNSLGSITSAPAILTVLAASPAQNIQFFTFEASGSDWNTDGNWEDGLGGQSALADAEIFPYSTFELMPGSQLRNPITPPSVSFPGVQLTVDGSGVFVNDPDAGNAPLQAQIKFKGNVTPTTNYYPLLVMAGGQLDNGGITGGLVFDLQGTLDIISNTPIYVDSGGSDGRPFQIDALLEGNASIEFHDFDATLSGGLDITGTNNTYTGTWNIVIGPLVGNGSNSLGTNTITIGSNGVLETSYPIQNINSTLFLNGQMFLTQSNTFSNVVVGGVALPAGVYTAATLSSTYPGYFPATFPAVYGATATNAAGYLNVLASPTATITENPTPSALSVFPTQTAQFTAAGSGVAPLTNQWLFNNVKLTDGTNADGSVIIGSQTTTLTIANVMPNEGGNYTYAISSAYGGNVSTPAVLTVLPTLPAENIQLTLYEPGGDDWNTVGVWNDNAGGLPASTSAVEYPGSTYEILPGTLLRTPAAAVPFTNFPGLQLTVDGDGVFTNNGANIPGLAQGEIRFKEGESGETNFFPLLIMAGGQLDIGVNGVTEILGTMDVISNTPIYIDSAAGAGNPRQYLIDAYLEGNGSIEYHDYDATLSGGLDITCSTNTYAGTWNVVQGPLVGSGANALGTNNITVGANGVLETLYNINSPHALLTVNGRVFLHQNDTFNQVQIEGVGLSAGTYSYAQLAAAFPAAFPAAWTSVFGSTSNSASGSITALTSLVLPPFIASQPPSNAVEFVGAKVTYSVKAGGSQGSYQWYVNGSMVNGATGSAYTFTSTAGPNTYYVIVSNSLGMATNMVATNSAATPPTPVTFDDPENWSLQGVGITPYFNGGVPNVLTLTDDNLNEAASAFYNTAQYIEGFDTSFTYTPSGLLAADGITFCVQNAVAGPAALGATGGSLGYNGITNSAAFELNIYGAATGGVGIGFDTNGLIALPYGPVTNINPALSVNLTNGNPININLYYSGGVVQAMLVDSVTSNMYVTNVTVGDIGAVVGDSVGYIGFTGGDGGSASIQQISNFSFLAAAPPVLSISNSGAGSFTFSWSGGVLPSFILQQSSAVNGPWSNVSITPTMVGSQYQVVLTPGTGSQFYRFGLQ